MGKDPYGPGYHPDGQGTRPNLGDVGHGDQFGLDLYALFRAGRLHFPEQAARFSGLASDAQSAGSSIKDVQSAAGYPSSLAKILDLRERLHNAIFKMTVSPTEIGPVLVKVADDYAATDQAARDAFNGQIDSVAEAPQYTSPPVTVPDPPRPDEPYVSQGGHPTRPGY